MEVNAPREKRTGRYAPRNFDAVCVCGHTLGNHTAERATENGRALQPCLAAELEGLEDCDCECFRRKRG